MAAAYFRVIECFFQQFSQYQDISGHHLDRDTSEPADDRQKRNMLHEAYGAKGRRQAFTPWSRPQCRLARRKTCARRCERTCNHFRRADGKWASRTRPVPGAIASAISLP